MLFSFADVWRLSQPQQACSRRRRRRRRLQRLRQFRTRRRLRPPEQSQRRGGSNGPEWLKKLLSQLIFLKTLLLNSVQIWSWKNSSFFQFEVFFSLASFSTLCHLSSSSSLLFEYSVSLWRKKQNRKRFPVVLGLLDAFSTKEFKKSIFFIFSQSSRFSVSLRNSTYKK